MQATSLPEQLYPWTQVQVVGVTQNNFCVYIIFQLSLMYGLNGASGTHWHKYRRVNFSMAGCNKAGSRC